MPLAFFAPGGTWSHHEILNLFLSISEKMRIFAVANIKNIHIMKKALLPVILAGSLLVGSCTFLDNLAKNVASIANLVNCEYTLKNISNVSVAGVNVKNVTNGNISATDVVKLVSAITTKSVPLNLDVNVDVKNPTTTSALLTAMDWVLDLASQEFATGVTNQNYSIPSNKTTTVPLGVNTDLYKMFSSDGINALKTFASSFTSDGHSSQMGLRIRPSVSVANQVIKSPNYIQILKPTTASTGSTGSTGSNGSIGTSGSNGGTLRI